MTDDKIWIGQNDKRYGPYKEADVRQWLQEGKLAHDALGWHEGMADWRPLLSLFPAAASEPSPVQPPPPPPRAPTPPYSAPVAAAAPVEHVEPVEPIAAAAAASVEPVEPVAAVHAANAYGPPATYGNDVASQATAERADFPAPPSLHWGLVLLFTMLTFGIFAIIWPFIQAKWVRKIDPQSSNITLLLGIAIACGVVGYISYFAGFTAMLRGETGTSMIGFGGLLMFGSWLLILRF